MKPVMGRFGYGTKNSEGETVLGICQNHGLRILNTFFQKEEEKLITYKSGDNRTQIDLLLMRRATGVLCTDCHAVPGEECLTQHRPVRAKISVAGYRRKIYHGIKRVKLWRLKDPEKRIECQEKLKRRLEESSVDMEILERNIFDTCKEICGETTGRRGRERETWWWNETVQGVIKEKKSAFKRWQRSRDLEDREAYRRKKNEAKRKVREAKKEAWRQWSEALNTREGQNKLFRVAAQMKKDRTDIPGSRFIKDANGNLIVNSLSVAERWKQYFSRLLNVENDHQIETCAQVSGPVDDITAKEVEIAISKMKDKRATGPSGVAAEMFKGMGKLGIAEMTEALRKIASEGRIPDSWKNSTTIALYKGKGDALDCSKHRGLRLLEHGFKIYEKVLEGKLRELTSIGENQFGFIAEKSTIGAIFIVRQLQEKYLEKKKKLYHVFVDLEKAFDKIPRKAIEWALRRQFVPELMVQRVMLLYEGSKSRVRVGGEESESFPINVGVHQGSALSPLLFILIMEEATKECQGEAFWHLLYADDLVLSAETKEAVEAKFMEWKSPLERRGMNVNIGKTKLMVTGKKAEVIRSGRYPCGVCGSGVRENSIFCSSCQNWCHKRCSGLHVLREDPNFICPSCSSPRTVEDDDTIEIDGNRIEEVKEFCYLGDMLDSEGSVERAVRMRVAAAWMKWREIASLLTNKQIPLRHRGNVYGACIRSVLLYGAESWAMTQRVLGILTSCDRRMLRYMAGLSLQDRVSSAEVASRCGVEVLENVARRRRLRWYGHVQRREESDPLRRVGEFFVEGRRPPGRPKKSWKKTLEEDMHVVGARKEDAMDRDRWRSIIRRQTPG